jgi:hypothetical protein
MQKSLNIAQMPHYCKTLVRSSVLFHDDCFNILSSIQNGSVDLILCDYLMEQQKTNGIVQFHLTNFGLNMKGLLLTMVQ